MLATLALFALTTAHAGKAKTPLDKDLHKDLHKALEDPSQPPPPYILEEDDQAKLDNNEMVFHYEHIKGHDLAVCVVTTWADKWEVWRAIKALNEYPEYLEELKWAKLEKNEQKDGYELIEASMEINIPLIPGNISVHGQHYIDRGFMSFTMIEAKKNPFKHGMGYWSVSDYTKGRTLVIMMVDVLPDFPIPNGARGSIAESTMPYFVWNMARRAENEFNKREKFLRELE
jgi:ribosome-associated toxin RatA of RatAB toxin-antitoxin module